MGSGATNINVSPIDSMTRTGAIATSRARPACHAGESMKAFWRKGFAIASQPRDVSEPKRDAVRKTHAAAALSQRSQMTTAAS